MNSILRQMVDFNTDPEIIKIRERINEASVFEVLGKERSETAHSSFLSWLLKSEGIQVSNASPANLFLQLLAQRGLDQNSIDEFLCTCISTNQLQIGGIEIETEVPVKALAANAALDYTGHHRDLLNAIIQDKKESDRVDIVVDIDVNGCDDIEHLQIIIENKIESGEGSPKSTTKIDGYDNLSQTERYYKATKRDKPGFVQLYVFIAPIDFNIEDYCNYYCSCENYINICYQDIMDKVLIPLLSSNSLTLRTRNLIEDYKNELTFPSLTRNSQVLACDRISEKSILNIWERHKFLIASAVFGIADTKYYIIDGYFTNDPLGAKKDIIGRLLPEHKGDLLSKGWVTTSPQRGYEELENRRGYYIKTNIWLNNVIAFAKQKGVSIEEKGADGLSPQISEAILSFWNANKDFLTRLLKTIHYIAKRAQHEISIIRETDLLIQLINRRDTTKYYVSFNEIPQNTNPIGKGEAALSLVRCWIQSNATITLEQLRKDFPIDCNDYYKNGGFQYLFYDYSPDYNYQYDGDGITGHVIGHWDFHKDDKHCITMPDGSKVAMLKMWRKSSLEGLLKFIQKHHPAFYKKLQVIPV